MQPIPNINIQSPSPMQGMGLAQGQVKGQSETGEFDFMNYLLGLQDPQTSLTPDALLALGVQSPEKGATDPSRDPLQAMFAAFPMQQPMNPSLMADVKKPVVIPSVNEGETPGVAMEMGKPQWISSEDLMKATNALVPSSTEALDAMTDGTKAVKSEEKGIPLEGFEKVADQAGIDLSISRKGQQLAAKKYAAQSTEAEPKTEAPVVEAARPRMEKAVETSNSSVAQATISEVKPETVSQKKANGESSSLEVNGFSSASSLHKAEVAQVAVDNKAASGPSGPVALPEVMHRVETLVQKGGVEMTVALDPPDLGRIQVKVTTRGNRVEVEMRSESVHAKNAIESHFAELKHSMQSQDLHLAKLEVQVHHDPMSFSGQSFAGMNDGRHTGQTQGGPNQGQGRQSSFSEGNRRLDSVSSIPQVSTVRSSGVDSGNGRVDLRI